MLLTDEELVEKAGIKPKDRVLDIGGSMRQHELIKVDTLVDYLRPEEAPYGASRLLAKHFVKADITKEKLPFKDKEFDICLCTHTLEDLPQPFLVLAEMMRVAKRGIIVTPSMGKDMEYSKINFTDWLTGASRVPGYAHHKWFYLNEKGVLKVIPKNYPILYTHGFQIVKWSGEEEMVYLWQNKINYEEVTDLNIHSLIDEYENFVKKNIKFIKKGRVLFFVDSPINLLKATAKKIMKRGVGYKYRKTL